VDAGVKFTESFVSTSLCCPSRASLLTGQVSHNSGVKDNVLPTGGATLILDEETVPVWLKRAGYRTGLVGKYLNGYGDNTQPSPKDNPSYIPPGWDDWQALTTYGMYNYKISDNGVVVTYGSSPQDYQTDVLKGRALTFIAEAEANDAQPFFLLVTPFAPHQESVTGPGCSGSVKQPVTIRPAPRHAGTLDPGVVLVPGPAFNEADMSDKPPVLRRLTSYKAIDKTCTRAFWRARLEAMMAVDELVGALVADLEAKGELADTALILTSDNGYHFGQHRFNNKILGYEESIRVPLAIRAPGNGAGQFSARMVMNTDLAPTILELAHAASAINEDGRSLVPLLVNPAAPWRSRVFGEYLGVNVPGGRKFRFIRTGPDDTTAPNDAYILWSDGAVEYYDLDADPFQLQSRHADPATLVQRNYLRGLVDQFKTCAGPACAALEN
jgi:arylsulfatase A-like enzyme